MVEKMILTQRVHLGFVRETFNCGAVLECDTGNGLLTVDGSKRFTETRDVDILKRANMVIPYSDESLALYTGRPVPPFPEQTDPGKKPGANMQVVQSDADLTEEHDISETQVSKRREEKEKAAKEKVARDGMPVIQADESIDEVKARQATEGTASVQTSEVDQDVDGKVRGMDVVSDDGYGYEGGSAAAALNAGQSLPNRKEVEAKTEMAKSIAESRKGEADRTRGKGQEEGRIPPLPTTPIPEAVGETSEAEEALADDPRDAKIEELSAQNQKLSSQVDELMSALKSQIKPKGKGGRPKGSKNKVTKNATKVTRSPVTDPAKKEAVEAAAEGGSKDA